MTTCDQDDGSDDGDPLPPCPHCGHPDADVVTVEYDAMVDGTGCVETEERCEACL